MVLTACNIKTFGFGSTIKAFIHIVKNIIFGVFITVLLCAGLVVNVDKTEILAQVSAAQTSVTPTFSIAGSNLNKVHQFSYLGSILTEDCDLTNEINHPIKLSAAAFGRLSQRVFFNHNLTVATKVSVYHAICLSILLYGCESWTLYRRHVKVLEAHHIKCLQSILSVRWWHKVPHAEIRRKAYSECIE